MVRSTHRLLVVLDDQHGVAEVAQPLERRNELRVVALVQPDRGLVQNVEHADQRRADLRGEPDPLRLAARQRRGRAIHREVADPDVLEEAQALADLAHDQARDVAFGVAQLNVLQPAQRAARRQRAELVDRRPRHQHREGLGPQPRAVAVRAGPDAHVLLDLLAREIGLGLAVAPLQVVHDALETRGVGTLATVTVAVANLDPLAFGAVEEDLPLGLAERAPRRLDVDPVALGQSGGHLVVVAGVAHRPRRERALRDRQLGVRHDQLRIDLELRAQAGAARAGALRRVEREDPRLELRHRRPALQAGELLRERQRLPQPTACPP